VTVDHPEPEFFAVFELLRTLRVFSGHLTAQYGDGFDELRSTPGDVAQKLILRRPKTLEELTIGWSYQGPGLDMDSVEDDSSGGDVDGEEEAIRKIILKRTGTPR
jgi:hypothetical protein